MLREKAANHVSGPGTPVHFDTGYTDVRGSRGRCTTTVLEEWLIEHLESSVKSFSERLVGHRGWCNAKPSRGEVRLMNRVVRGPLCWI
jgi:hypothetical protein